jgi:hypothetical protein
VHGATSSSLRARRHHLDRQRRARADGFVDDVDDLVGRKRLAQISIGLAPDRLEERLRSVVGGHHDDDGR